MADQIDARETEHDETAETAAPAAGETPQPTKVDDATAQLLKDMMGWKEKARKAEKALEARKLAEDQAKQAELAERGEFKKLAEQAQQEAATARAELKRERITNQVVRALRKADVEDTLEDLALAAVGIDKLELNEELKVDGLEELVAALKESRPKLFKAEQPPPSEEKPREPRPGVGPHNPKANGAAQPDVKWATPRGSLTGQLSPPVV